jgi:hypothetical protein
MTRAKAPRTRPIPVAPPMPALREAADFVAFVENAQLARQRSLSSSAGCGNLRYAGVIKKVEYPQWLRSGAPSSSPSERRPPWS